MPKRTSNPDYLRARAAILTGNPLCHWCGRNPATEADHLIEHDRGGTDTTDNLVPACKPCNARRGQQYRERRDRARQQAREQALAQNAFFHGETSPPTPQIGRAHV